MRSVHKVELHNPTGRVIERVNAGPKLTVMMDVVELSGSDPKIDGRRGLSSRGIRRPVQPHCSHAAGWAV